MQGNMIVSGLLGGVVLIAWTFLVSGILGVGRSIERKPIATETTVHEMLKASLAEPVHRESRTDSGGQVSRRRADLQHSVQRDGT
jgi:hypothetical protein